MLIKINKTKNKHLIPQQEVRRREITLPLTPGLEPLLPLPGGSSSLISLSPSRHCLQFTYISRFVAIYSPVLSYILFPLCYFTD